MFQMPTIPPATTSRGGGRKLTPQSTPKIRPQKPDRSNICGFEVQSTISEFPKLFQTHLLKKHQGTPVAYVFGGGPAGYMSALALEKQGFHVFVFEKRQTYTRTNNVELKQEAMNMVAHVSPEGYLFEHLLAAGLNAQSFKGQQGEHYEGRSVAGRRFLNWLTPRPANPLGPRIPVFDDNRRACSPMHEKGSGYLNLEKLNIQNMDDSAALDFRRSRLEALDLAWPWGLPITAVEPDAYVPPEVPDYGVEDFGSIMLRDLDQALNSYCVDNQLCPNIDVVCGEGHIIKPDSAYPKPCVSQYRYSPSVQIGTDTLPRTLSQFMTPELIVLADGASSTNVEELFGSNSIGFEQTQEVWYQSNFSVADRVKIGDGSVLVHSDAKPLSENINNVEQKDGSFLSNIIFHETRADPVINSSTMMIGTGETSELNQVLRLHTLSALNKAVAPAKRSMQNLNVHLEPFEQEQNLRVVPITLRRARTTIDGNLCIVGDAAVSGSPVGGYGASLAMSAWPHAVGKLGKQLAQAFVEKKNTARQAQWEYSKAADAIAQVRIGRSLAMMQSFDGYSFKTCQMIVDQLLLGNQKVADNEYFNEDK